jgi:type I restriction enzyme S subunit
MPLAEDEWSKTKLTDVIKIEHGYAFKSEYFGYELTGEPLVIGVGNFDYEGGLRLDTTEIKEYRGEYPKEYELCPEDVLLVMTCQTPGGEILGIPGRIPDDGRLYLHNQRMGKMVVHQPDLVCKDFLYYLFLTTDFNSELVASSTGTKILHTAPTRIEAFEFMRPPLDVQRRIGSLLRLLDEKIEANKGQNKCLTELISRCFRSWFVDFESTAKNNNNLVPTGLTAKQSKFFPSEFEKTDFGLVPKGWNVERIDSLLSLEKKSVAPITQGDELFSCYSFAGFDIGKRSEKLFGRQILSNKHLVPDDCVLISKLNPHTPRVWLPFLTEGEKAVCSTEFLVCKPKAPFDRFYLYAFLISEEFSERFSGLVTGTSGSHQRVKPEDFLRMQVTIPSKEAVMVAQELIAPWAQLIGQNEAENHRLLELRKCLLPKLYGGEISLKEADKLVAAVV